MVDLTTSPNVRSLRRGDSNHLDEEYVEDLASTSKVLICGYCNQEFFSQSAGDHLDEEYVEDLATGLASTSKDLICGDSVTVIKDYSPSLQVILDYR